MKTYFPKRDDIARDFYVIDAKDLVLGRLAVIVADLLRGKNKPIYAPGVDCGDHVIITNAQHVVLTGNKLDNKYFYWHTGFPGGIKKELAKDTLRGEHAERLVARAIKRMITRNPLGRLQLKRLRIYCEDNHPHTGQEPKQLDVKSMNKKNFRASK